MERLDQIRARVEKFHGPLTEETPNVIWSLEHDIPWLIGECDIRRAWNTSLHEQLAASKTEVERLKGLLGRLEWACVCDDGEPAFCPVCAVYKGHRHEPACWLAKELGRTAP
jgi:hypothetical protein